MVRMSYPEQSLLPKRARQQSAALGRRANPVDFEGKPFKLPPPPTRGKDEGVILYGRHHLALSLGAFRSADFGQLCQHLGLSPSRPDRDAQGKRHRRRRAPEGVTA